MQSCSTQNHTRASWHQSELVRADLGSLMRWARAHPHTERGLGGSLRGTGGSKLPPGSSKSMIVAQKQSKKASKQAPVRIQLHTAPSYMGGAALVVVAATAAVAFLLSFLHSFLITCISLFVTAKKTKKNNTFHHNTFKQALPELLIY